MEELAQSTIAFPVRKRGTPGRRKIVADVDEEEKENSPTKKMQIEKPTRRKSIMLKPRKMMESTKLELESIIQTLDLTSNSDKPLKQSENTSKSEVASKSETESKTEEEKVVASSNQKAAPTIQGINYKKTKQALHTSIPDWLVGRKAESEEINKFLTEHVENFMPGSIYISGAPGTGKTAVLMKTLEALQCPSIKVVINCMTHKNSQSIFNAIRLSLSEADAKSGLKKSSASSKEAVTDIEEFITSSKVPVVMVFDEIDSLDSRNQEVLYTIFEWPALDDSRLVLVGVANSLDLTDRILPRLLSRKKCKPKLLNFSPYSREEIAKIILERLAKLGSESAIEPLSVHFCARKLSSMSGDLRMALDVCRRAVDVVEMEMKKNPQDETADEKTQRAKKVVGLPVILKVINEVYGQKVVAKSDSQLRIPLQQMLAVCTLLLMGKNTRASKEVSLAKFHENYTKICKKNGVTGIERSEFLSLCTSMEDQGLVGIKKAKEVRLYKMSLRINEKELESAIQDKTLLSSILSKGLS